MTAPNEPTTAALIECKRDVAINLVRATLLCGNNPPKPKCPNGGLICPFKIHKGGRLYRGEIYTCSVALMNLILE